MAEERTILHADMDAFYASVEERDDPRLVGKPLVVGGPVRRGVVAAASYAARTYGIHSAMPMAQALRRCPQLVVIRPRMEHYVRVSQHVFAIFGRFSPLVEPLSLDEAFLDLTGTTRLHGAAEAVGRHLKQQVRDELGLVVSVGVGPSKFIAKLASDLGKPDGLVVVRAEEVEALLCPLPVSRVYGVGRVTQAALDGLGIATIGELAAYPREVLQSRFGEHGSQLWALAHGLDPRPVQVVEPPQSIGSEDTFEEDLDDLALLAVHIQEQADEVARRLRQELLQASVVVLKVKTPDFKLHTRRRGLNEPTSDGGLIGRTALELLGELLPRLGAVRLTGVAGAGLVERRAPRQLSFDEPAQRQQEGLARTLDQITERFGRGAVTRAWNLAAQRDPRRRG